MSNYTEEQKKWLHHIRELVATKLMDVAGPSPVGKCEWDEGSRLANAVMPIFEEVLNDPEYRRVFATVGLEALIDEATGFQKVRPKDSLQRKLERELGKKASKVRDA